MSGDAIPKPQKKKEQTPLVSLFLPNMLSPGENNATSNYRTD